MKVFLQVTLIAQCAPGTTQTCLSLPTTKYLNPLYHKMTPFFKQFFASLSIESWLVSKRVIFQHSTTTKGVKGGTKIRKSEHFQCKKTESGKQFSGLSLIFRNPEDLSKLWNPEKQYPFKASLFDYLIIEIYLWRYINILCDVANMVARMMLLVKKWNEMRDFLHDLFLLIQFISIYFEVVNLALAKS